MLIPFTQYMLPNGRQVATFFECEKGLDSKVREILDAGFRFTCEILSTGKIAVYISDEEEGFALEVCANGPEIGRMIKGMIEKFDINVRRGNA